MTTFIITRAAEPAEVVVASPAAGSGGPTHMAWPFRMAGKRLAVVEQDSIEDVQQNVRAYLHTPRGERPLSPDFGLEDPTFSAGVNTALLAADIEAAEDGRAVVTVDAGAVDAYGRQTINVSVELAE